MRKLLSITVYVIVIALTFQSCKKEQQAPQSDEISQKVLTQIHNLGFSTNGVIKVEEGYIVEGDLLISDSDLVKQPVSNALIVANTEQYRTNNYISNFPRTIIVNVEKLEPYYTTATEAAIKRYNDLNLGLTFQIGRKADITITSKNDSYFSRNNVSEAKAVSSFPPDMNTPYKNIYINKQNVGTNPNADFLTSLIAHEIGHCIGFRHTDYIDKRFSCNSDAGQIVEDNTTATYGAIHIPGTPMCPDVGSWMLACFADDMDHPFTPNDQAALSELFDGNAEICSNGIDDNNNGEIDENCYQSVTIGSQVWMLKNLDACQYRDGTPIPQVTDPSAWAGLTEGAWCYYFNSANGVYGKLYNWYAVNNPKGLAPIGWHIPTYGEWQTLSDYLGGNTVAGDKLKSLTRWNSPNTTGYNSSGFTALPGGFRTEFDGTFYDLNISGRWWSSTRYEFTNSAWNRYILYYDAGFNNNISSNAAGLSVRCIKD